MKTFIQMILIATTVIAATFISAAQTLSPTAPTKRHYKYDGKIVTSFDNERGETIVGLQLMRVKDVEDPHPIDDNARQWDRLAFSFGFSYPGKKLIITPKFVVVAFSYEALEPQKYEGNLLSFKLDREDRRELGRMTIRSEARINHKFAYKPYTWRTLEMSVPYEELLRLANAKKVKMRLGSFDFDLTEDHLEAIRDLASRTVP